MYHKFYQVINNNNYICVSTERPGSFGLHSPDKVPQNEAELRHLTLQYRERHETDVSSNEEDVSETSALDHPTYNPKLFCDGGLYFDPDIIGMFTCFG